MENYTSAKVNDDFMNDKILDLIMSDMNLGVIIINQEWRIIEISDLACRIFGMTKEILRHQPMFELFRDMPVQYHLIQQSMMEGIVYRNYPLTYQNGMERYELLIDTNFVRGDQHEILGLCITFKDVTNLRTLEEQVIRSDRLATIGQIAAGAAHEIRNPLTSIKGFLQLFERRFAAEPDSREQQYIRIMMKEIDRINQLVGEFLLLSKPRAPQWQTVDVVQTIQEIYPIIQSESNLKNVIIEWIKPIDLLPVIADREMFKQVVLNLCKNAFEAMPNGGFLRIELSNNREEKMVSIRITDSGHGIAPYLLDKIFDPFFTTKSEGTGLGLAICQRIIHDIGGQIRVSSKGFGTTFHIIIPSANTTSLH